jgi:hypothetical protein
MLASFQDVVQTQDAERVHKAEANATLGDGLALRIHAGGLVDVNVAHRAGRQNAPGADDVKGA